MLFRLLALCTLIIAFPLSSHALLISNSFLTSSTGNTTLGVGDTIQFEVSVTTTNGFDYSYGDFWVTGDITTAVSCPASLPCIPPPVVAQLVTNWEWNYKPGTNEIQLGGTNASMVPPPLPPMDLPAPIIERSLTSLQPFFTGNGDTRLIGTVTITTNSAGAFLGGAFAKPLVSAWGRGVVTESSPIAGASYTVIPEPGTFLSIALGLGYFGMMARGQKR